MTLVVARQFENAIRILSDAKLTSPELLNDTPLRAALKVVALNDVCIAFAGTYLPAIDALRTVHRSGLNNVDEILVALMEAHTESNFEVDFLLLTHAANTEIIKISNREVSRNCETAWIGDIDAFSKYQEYYHCYQASDHEYQDISRMSHAMESVINDNSIESVGQFLVTTVVDANGVEYFESTSIFAPSQKISAGEPSQIQFGNAAQGGYAYSVLTPEVKGVGAIGVYFFQGRLGALYHPLESDEALIYRDVSFLDFQQQVYDQCGFKIAGSQIS